MKKIAISVLTMGCLALVTSVAFANYGNDNKISGYVKEKGTLKPIKGATVKLYTKGGTYKKKDTSSLKGKYSFKKLSEKKYVVKTTAKGYRSPNSAKTKITSTVKADGSSKKNFYFMKIPVVGTL